MTDTPEQSALATATMDEILAELDHRHPGGLLIAWVDRKQPDDIKLHCINDAARGGIIRRLVYRDRLAERLAQDVEANAFGFEDADAVDDDDLEET
jgi:hypothetical protein